MFTGRSLLIVTQHQKEKVIAPVLEKALGVKCFVAYHYDTDELGTFSGEIERKLDAVTTARNKCLNALKDTNFDLAVSSEGSFGAHPSFFLLPADEETLMFIDKKNNLEITSKTISTETNFNGKEITTEKELWDFASKVQFPSHGLILKNEQHHFSEVEKGITAEEVLKECFQYFIQKYQKVFLETDMRALYNPSRMKVIEKATLELAKKINSFCPQCNMPGFGITEVKKGLPCSECHLPTRSVLGYLYSCQKCGHQKEESFPHEKKTEQPDYCDFCNP